MKAYWVYANVDGAARWHLVLDREGEVDFVEIDFQEEMEFEEYREEFPHVKIVGPILRPDACTCDAIGDDPCPVHCRENDLQDALIAARNELAEIIELVGESGDGTAKGCVESCIASFTEMVERLARDKELLALEVGHLESVMKCYEDNSKPVQEKK